VAEPLRDQEWLLLRGDQVGDVSVSQIVEPDSLHIGPGDPPVEHLSYRLGVDGGAVRLGEDEIAIVAPVRANK